MMDKQTYPQVVTVRMTNEMHANLLHIAASDRKIATVIREAISAYFDQQADIVGSRRYFIGRFKERVELLERLVTWQLTLLTILVAEVSAILIHSLIEIPAEDQQNFTGPALLHLAEQRTIESGWRVRRRLTDMIDASEATERRTLK